MRTLVVPSNDAGYLAPAFDQGIIATSSTNSFDGFQSFPLYGDYVDISLLPAKNIFFTRLGRCRVKQHKSKAYHAV